MEAIVIGDGHIGVRESLARSLSSLATIATGGSIGREGSMVQLAAMVASVIGRVTLQSAPQLRLLVACGSAAGITAAYSAPIAGALFISEIVLGSIAMDTFGPLLVSAVVSNATMRALTSYRRALPDAVVPGDRGPRDGAVRCARGRCRRIASPLFLCFLDAAKRGIRPHPRLPLAVRMGIGGLVVGAISVHVPEVWGNGYSVVNALLHQDWLWPTVLVVLLAKVVATAATTGSGAVGGIFTPTIFVGAAMGLLFGQAVHAVVARVHVRSPLPTRSSAWGRCCRRGRAGAVDGDPDDLRDDAFATRSCCR